MTGPLNGDWTWDCGADSCSTANGGLTGTSSVASISYTVFGKSGSEGGGALGNAVIIGDGTHMFELDGELPKVSNAPGSGTGNIGQFCMEISPGKLVRGPNQVCRSVGNLLGGQASQLSMSSVVGIVGDTSDLGTDEGYRDGAVRLYTDRDPKGVSVKFRVAKPAISGINGGNAFAAVKTGWDVNHLVDGFFNELKTGNFLVTTVNGVHGSDLGSGRDLTSSVYSVAGDAGNSDAAVLHKAVETKELSISGLGSCSVANISGSVDKNSSLCAPAANPGSGTKTVIAENGDIVFKNDLAYADKDSSWAWVAKNGNIIIDDGVGKIAGVLVALCSGAKSDACGRIVHSGGATAKQLVVEGGLYGDASDLVEHRTYIRGTDPSSPLPGKRMSLTTGTVIRWSNRALLKSPPMLDKFIEKFLYERVAK